jgi:disulfide bond formation protein DsbB
MGFGTYHVLEQNIPGFGSPALCRAGVPCSLHYIHWLGFITIPVLSLTAFTLITALLSTMRGRRA